MSIKSGFTFKFPVKPPKKQNSNLPNKDFHSFKTTNKKDDMHPPFYAKSDPINLESRNLPSGYSPLQLSQAYKTDLVEGSPTGKGIIIGIIDAYGYARAAADFKLYCEKYGLKTPNIITDATKLLTTPPTGTFNFMIKPMASKLSTNTGWAQEQALDIQMAHAIAPDASILLVQATSATSAALNDAIKYAVSVGATVISNSWGGSESKTNPLDATFSVPNNVIYTCSAGDSIGIKYPSANPHVVSVGGTRILMSQVNGRWTRTDEKAWYINTNNSTGGGVSLYQPATYQTAGDTKLGPKIINRYTPDISCVADPTYGVAVCYNNAWYVFGGTSVAAPVIAGMIALANELRLRNNKTTLSSPVLKTALYTLMNTANTYPEYFYDVKTGGTGQVGTTAVSGYDTMTGVGAPNCDSFVPWLASL